MYHKMLSVLLLAVLLSVSAVRADLDPLAPVFSFEMSAEHLVDINGDQNDIALMSFHESSQAWVLFIRHSTYDVAPYDNLTISVTCNEGSTAIFDTVEYSQWVNEGILSIEFPYQTDSYSVTYNSEDFSAKYSRCVLEVDDYGAGSYMGNNTGNYTRLSIETIPYLAVIEFVNCSASDTAEMNLVAQLSSATSMMTEAWTILWLIYSIFIMVFAVFMIPTFIFILIRWAIFRVAGFKLVERKDSGGIS